MDTTINNYNVFKQIRSYGTKENGQSCYGETHVELHSIKWRETLLGSPQITI